MEYLFNGRYMYIISLQPSGLYSVIGTRLKAIAVEDENLFFYFYDGSSIRYDQLGKEFFLIEKDAEDKVYELNKEIEEQNNGGVKNEKRVGKLHLHKRK